MGSLDFYCERVGPGFWAEPVNALTNAAFLLAAWAAWRLARRAGALTLGIGLLIAVACAIGAGSFLFHTFAAPWALTLDIVPILVFQVLFLWIYARRVMALPDAAAALLAAAFLGVALSGRQFTWAIGAPAIYLPALVALLALGLYHAVAKARGRLDLFAVAGVFALSLGLRSMDDAVCAAFPLGTHFLWHVLNGLVLYLAIRALVRQITEASDLDPNRVEKI